MTNTKQKRRSREEEKEEERKSEREGKRRERIFELPKKAQRSGDAVADHSKSTNLVMQENTQCVIHW